MRILGPACGNVIGYMIREERRKPEKRRKNDVDMIYCAVLHGVAFVSAAEIPLHQIDEAFAFYPQPFPPSFNTCIQDRD
jgi:hypothetical protein